MNFTINMFALVYVVVVARNIDSVVPKNDTTLAVSAEEHTSSWSTERTRWRCITRCYRNRRTQRIRHSESPLPFWRARPRRKASSLACVGATAYRHANARRMHNLPNWRIMYDWDRVASQRCSDCKTSKLLQHLTELWHFQRLWSKAWKAERTDN